MNTPNPTSRSRRKEARPAEISAAALELFVEKGFTATRLDDVAERAGVSKGTVYLYFENKEALFKAAVEAAMLPAVEAAEALPAQPDASAREMLRCFVFGWWQMIGSTTAGGIPKLLVAESGNFPEVARWFHDSLIMRAKEAVRRVIELGIARGEFRPLDAAVATRVVFAPLFAYVVWRNAFEFMTDLPDPETYLDNAVTMLTEGMAVRTPKEGQQQ